MIRKGEVRINGKRIQPSYRLQANDQIRIPPTIREEKNEQKHVQLDRFQLLKNCVLYEDDRLMVINKPAGLSVHAGSGDPVGLIDALRTMRTDLRYIELAHRLDKDTSGCLLLAKKRSMLRTLHLIFREGPIQKTYVALATGKWPHACYKIDRPLERTQRADGEKIVKVSSAGKNAMTMIKILQEFPTSTLIEASPQTGRTHQIRVHCASMGHPIAGDLKYGRKEANDIFWQVGLRRMFLHAAKLEFVLPLTGEKIAVTAPLPEELSQFLEKI